MSPPPVKEQFAETELTIHCPTNPSATGLAVIFAVVEANAAPIAKIKAEAAKIFFTNVFIIIVDLKVN